MLLSYAHARGPVNLKNHWEADSACNALPIQWIGAGLVTKKPRCRAGPHGLPEATSTKANRTSNNPAA
jgi:hypothetical protein